MPKETWVQHATRTSNAMDLDAGVFGWSDPKKIARSLKRSVEKSKRLKNTPFASAISMVTFFENRMGKNLSPERRQIMQQVKVELRKLFGRD